MPKIIRRLLKVKAIKRLPMCNFKLVHFKDKQRSKQLVDSTPKRTG